MSYDKAKFGEYFRRKSPEENKIEMAIHECRNGAISSFVIIKELSLDEFSKYGVSRELYDSWSNKYNEFSKPIG